MPAISAHRSLLGTAILVLACSAQARADDGLTKAACEAMAQKPGPPNVDKAEWVMASTIDASNPAPYKADVPAHCALTGRLNPRIGFDGKPYAIGYELRLPVAWNGKFFFQGGGGSDGVLRTAVGTLPGGGPVTNALTQGYAVASTDAGHRDEPGPIGPYLFGLDPQARLDKGYVHIPVVFDFAKATIGKLYGRSQSRSYFVGCSNGGRQAMDATQRYPALFDGVIVGAPAYRVAYAAIDSVSQIQTLSAIAPKFADGTPDIGSALTAEDLKVVAAGIIETCDAADGVKDGMVFNPAACHFDPASIACRPGQDTKMCLAPEKAKALEAMYSGRKLSSGKQIYSDWPYDPGLDSPGWTAWRLGTPGKNPPDARDVTLIPGSLAYYFTTPPVAAPDLLAYELAYDFDRDVPKVDQSAPPFVEPGGQIENATSTDLTVFKAHGGKIIFYHGLADPIFSANDTMRYVDALAAKYPDASDFTRLYLVPGMNHCSGGPAADQFEMLGALDSWVEKGTPPGTVIAKARAAPGVPWPGRTRPLCVYPQSASYKGTGDIEDAANFACK